MELRDTSETDADARDAGLVDEVKGKLFDAE